MLLGFQVAPRCEHCDLSNAQFSVCAFTAEIDGKVINGTIKEKQKAKDTYDDAIASGHGTNMLSQALFSVDQPTRPDLYPVLLRFDPFASSIKSTIIIIEVSNWRNRSLPAGGEG